MEIFVYGFFIFYFSLVRWRLRPAENLPRLPPVKKEG
jgi:hypothetical protein